MKEFNDGIIVVNNLGDDRWAVNIGESHIFTAKTEEEVVAKAKQWRESYPHQIGRKAEVEPAEKLAERVLAALEKEREGEVVKLAERILAALEKEREGEVVLWPVTKEDKVLIRVTNEPSDKYKHFTGVSGKLVFIPEAK